MNQNQLRLQLLFAVSIFLGAFLLFQVQPMMGRFILPWFGGGPAVWSSCLLFFQLALLFGYGYAHILASWVSPRRQTVFHLIFLTASLLFLPITPEEHWKPTQLDFPTLRILLLLAASVGVPYMLLSATGPLFQRWYGIANPLRSPYRFYHCCPVKI